jgi:hypothetical protein
MRYFLAVLLAVSVLVALAAGCGGEPAPSEEQTGSRKVDAELETSVRRKSTLWSKP